MVYCFNIIRSILFCVCNLPSDIMVTVEHLLRINFSYLLPGKTIEMKKWR